MKTKVLVLCAVLTVLVTATAEAGPRCGWGGGPGYYGGGGGWWAPNLSFGFYTAPAVRVVSPVYYTAPVYATPVYRVAGAGYSTLVNVQAKLARLGYYRGTVDGSYGPLTARAVELFQSDNGLPVTGRLDRRTVASLGV